MEILVPRLPVRTSVRIGVTLVKLGLVVKAPTDLRVNDNAE